MMEILIPILAVTVIGLICAVGLAVASSVMAVKEDTRFTEIRACLPGANCGACGYTGCDGYAKALLEPGTKTNLCVPGADAVAAQIAALLGVEAEDVVEKIAVVQCAGTCEATSVKADYRGIPSCAAAKLFYGGNGSCIFGCMGFGDCARACPKGAISCLTMPSLDAVQELLHAPQVRLILATGGGAMVRAAYSSGKPAIGVGAGNGPAYIHRSADIPRAVRDILRSKTFDNGTVCASEQSVIVERCCEARVREEFRKQGCYFLNTEEAGRVARLLLRPDGTINPKVVGRTACAVARMAGVTVPESTPVLLANETEAGPARPYSREKLCPILAFFVEEDEDTILRRICEVLAGEGAGHTFVLHAKDEAVVRRFALTVPVSRFLVNVPASLGGIGAETALFPALTLGCGAVGGSSSSNNIGPLDLINLRRVAWGSEKPEPQPETPDQPEPDSALIARLTEEILKKLR